MTTHTTAPRTMALTSKSHRELWARHHETIEREAWGFRTSGVRDFVGLVVAWTLTRDGADVAVVVRREDACSRLAEVLRTEAVAFADVARLFGSHVAAPASRVIVADLDGLVDAISFGPMPYTGPGGDA